ncbi:MAG: hypothetical protein HPY76_06185 [Anaerolineae bacterium]|nr:hypothetical protein [Anaerolineae bacterium]
MKPNQLLVTILATALLLAACAPAATVEPTIMAAGETPILPTATQLTQTVVPTELPQEPTEPPADAGGVSFANDVQPILDSRCASCHGLDRTSDGLDLTSYDNVMAGGENGVVVLPGDAANSALVTLSESGEMPKRGPKLTPDQIQTLKDWVNQGALNN